MLILNSPEIAQATLLRWKTESTIAFVPTMGCLHEGHLSLVRLAKTMASRVVVSIFVNPLQFGPDEDLAKYPRTFENDRELLEKEGVDILFAPTQTDLYPEGFHTRISTGPLSKYLCGASRPRHFDGVATICMKLFQITQPNIAVFGEKDFQQLAIVRQMVIDFNLPLNIVGHPIVRDTDGLALSSRNRYLTDSERQLAARLPQAVMAVQESLKDAAVSQILACVKNRLTEPFNLDYVAICSEDDLIPIESGALISKIVRPRLFVAVKLGTTRLIDNMKLL